MPRMLPIVVLASLASTLAIAQQPRSGGFTGTERPASQGAGGAQPTTVPGASEAGARPAGAQQGAPGAGGPPTAAGRQATGQVAAGRAQGGSLVAVARIETRTTSIGVAGRLEPARRIVHAAGAAGFAEAVLVRVGQRVEEGQALVTIGRDAPGESYRPLVIASRIGGRVSEVLVAPGAELRSGAAAVTVVDDAEYRLVAALSDKDAFRVAAMGGGELVARSADGVVLRGELLSVSAEPDYATGLFSATLRFASQPGARIGMALFMELPVESLRGQFVSQALVARRFGKSVMWVLDAEDRLALAQVTTGKPYGDEILVASGLPPGTRFLTGLTGYEKEGLALAEYRETLGKAP